MFNLYDVLKNLCEKKGVSGAKMCEDIGYSKSLMTELKSGRKKTIALDTASKIANYFGVPVEYLLTGSVENAVTVTNDYVTFPIIGDLAAGYEHIAVEDWAGDKIEIPMSYLKGHPVTDYFVLRIIGDSMYPMYQEGDKVLVLKQSTLDHSGQVGVVLYGGNTGTLKKVEYVMGEDWMKLIPINPMYSPMLIEGADLEDCRVLGVPKLLIREIEN